MKKINVYFFVIGLLLFNAANLTAQKKTAANFDEKEFAKTFVSKFTTANGVKLHYMTGGKGEPIVLIHGYPLSSYSWRKIMPALAEKYTVIAPDMRGLGDSEVMKTGYDKRTVAEDIHQLLESLKIKKYLLVSHDMGGPVAYALANAYPETVTKFVMIDSGIPGFGLEKAFDPANGGSWHFGFFMSDFAEMLTEGKEKEFLTTFSYERQNKWQPGTIAQKDINEYLRVYTKPGGMTAGFNYYRAFKEDAKYNQANFKAKLKMPILVVDGEKSFKGFTLSNVQNVAENARGVIIANCGHYVAEEQPEELIKQLVQFFAE